MRNALKVNTIAAVALGTALIGHTDMTVAHPLFTPTCAKAVVMETPSTRPS